MKNKILTMLIVLIVTFSIMSGQLLALSIGNNIYYEIYGEYKLEWKTQNGFNTLVGVNGSKLNIDYEYNENGNRISKISKSNDITYNYDLNSKIESENRDGILIGYLYDEMRNIIGFQIEDVTYYYLKDDDLNVLALTNAVGDVVAKYVYDEFGLTQSILGKTEKNEWVDMSNDSGFVGTLNLIRLHSYYYDYETGWYYNGFQYYDSVNNQYIMRTGANNDFALPLIAKNDTFINGSPSSRVSNSNISMDSLSDLQYYIVSWYGSLLNDPNFGKSISYSSSWYSNLQTVEILSRLIYAENTLSVYDQSAIAWVLINRKNANLSYLGGGTFRGVATYSGQFSTITGSSASTSQARNPVTSQNSWYNAVYLACCLLSTSNSSDYLAVFSRPIGISTQKYFVSLTYFLTKSRNDSDNDGYLEYDNGSWNDITNVTVVFTYSSSLINPSTISSITSNSNLDTSAERSGHNIFFNFVN